MRFFILVAREWPPAGVRSSTNQQRHHHHQPTQTCHLFLRTIFEFYDAHAHTAIFFLVGGARVSFPCRRGRGLSGLKIKNRLLYSEKNVKMCDLKQVRKTNRKKRHQQFHHCLKKSKVVVCSYSHEEDDAVAACEEEEEDGFWGNGGGSVGCVMECILVAMVTKQ